VLQDEVAHALADSRRRTILRLVRHTELPSGEIAVHFPEVTAPASSQHLRVLRAAGLVSDRRSGTPATVSEINAVVSEIRIAAPPEVVFTYLVDPEKMRRRFGSRAQLEPRPGGMYLAEINQQARARGAYLEVVPPSRVVFTFGWDDDPNIPPGPTRVEVTPARDGQGTHVRLVHAICRHLKCENGVARIGTITSRLAVVAAGGDLGPDPNSNPPLGGN
jgi:uncharacterized protein YndB with AHSA1/START domain